MLPGHTSYIQGVAWDPRGEHVVTQSADRSCKVHKVRMLVTDIAAARLLIVVIIFIIMVLNTVRLSRRAERW